MRYLSDDEEKKALEYIVEAAQGALRSSLLCFRSGKLHFI